MKARLAQMEAEASKLRDGQVPAPAALPGAGSGRLLLAPAQLRASWLLCRQRRVTTGLQRKVMQLTLRRVRRWTAAPCTSAK